jgi:phosphopantetheinyl transferase (holo-ACP synthase)
MIAISSMRQLRSFSGSEMSFPVQATIDGHTVLAPAETAKEAFAKAIEWHVAQRFADVAISDGRREYSIAEFSAAMAISEMTDTQLNS